MYRNKKNIAILIILITIFTWISPTAKVLAENTGVVKVNSKLQGVTYKLNSEVIEMPYGINYEVLEEEVIDYGKIDKPVSEEEIIKDSIKRKVSIPTKDDAMKKGLKLKNINKIPINNSTEEPLWNREKNYKPKTIIVDNKTLKKLNPKVGKVYFDPVNHTTIKITGEAKSDGSGGMIIPVEKPDLSEVIEDVNIPEQTVTLSREDIVYTNPEVKIVEVSSSSISQVASTGGFVPSERGAWIKINLNGLTLIKEGTDVENEKDDKARQEKLKGEKEKLLEESSYWKTQGQRQKMDEEARAEQAAIDKEREGETKLSADVKIKKGYIKIFDPEISASLDWDWGMLSAEARADIDIESDIVIEGKVKLTKEVEILIQGFEVDFKIGKIACGIYLVVGIDGSITFETRVQQQGTATVGVAAKGFLIPMVVYPFVDYNNTALETQMMLSGELKLWALAMPKITLEILDVKILDAGFRIGIEAGASFSIGGEEADTFRLWIDILLQFRVQAIFLGEGGFEERWNLYDRTKVYDRSQPIGGGSDGVSKIKGHVLIEIERIDAARDTIVGSVTRAQSPASEPELVQGDKVIIKILQVDGTEISYEATLDKKGEFCSNVPITPLDKVSISYNKEDLEYDYSTTSPYINIRPPYIVNSIFRDGFNNKVIGKVVGEIYGPNGIASDGDERIFEDDIYVRISKDKNSIGIGHYIQVDENGEFLLENVTLGSSDLISAGLIFEGARVETERAKPKLGLEIYHTVIEGKDKGSFRVEGAIQNLYGNKLYEGSVKFYNGKGGLIAETKAYNPNEISDTIETLKLDKTSELSIKSKLSGRSNSDIKMEISPRKSMKEKMKDAMRGIEVEISDPSTLFELNIPVPINTIFGLGGGYIEIEHNGIKKQINVIGKAKEIKVPVLEAAVVSPIEEIINSRINPAMGKDMKKAITNNAMKFQNSSAEIDVSQAHGVAYSFVQTPISQDRIYSFKEGDIQLVAKGGKGSVSLSWTNKLDKRNIEGYRLYRGVSSDGEDLKPITSSIINDTKYIDKSVAVGLKYYYLCSVVYENGDEFIISNEASGIPMK